MSPRSCRLGSLAFAVSLGVLAGTARGYVATELYMLQGLPGYTTVTNSNGGFTTIVNGQTVGWGNGSGVDQDAFVWSLSGALTDLNPTIGGNKFALSNGIATDGSQQVGSGRLTTNGRDHALVWSGTAGSAIDLTPVALLGPIDADAQANGIGGGQIVGWGFGNGNNYVNSALLWTSNSASSAVNLNPIDANNPNGWEESYAQSTDGTHQVGYGYSTASGFNGYHAVLWSGTAASAIDLNPSGYTDSYAYFVSGNQQVGSGDAPSTSNKLHALLWTGSAGSFVDLNPSGYNVSEAYGTDGNLQVGYATLAAGGGPRAALWNGSANTFEDLQTVLNLAYPGQFSTSRAYSIDALGDINGIAGDQRGNVYAVQWAVPEPSSIAVIGVGVITLMTRRRRRTDC